VFGARDVGDVFVPIDDLLAGAEDKARDPSPVTYQVRRPRSGHAHGVLGFCYKFIDVPAASAAANKEGNCYAKYVQADSAAADKVTAYPPPQQAYQPAPYGSAYPPQTY
jgi:hypothetical protein